MYVKINLFRKVQCGKERIKRILREKISKNSIPLVMHEKTESLPLNVIASLSSYVISDEIMEDPNETLENEDRIHANIWQSDVIDKSTDLLEENTDIIINQRSQEKLTEEMDVIKFLSHLVNGVIFILITKVHWKII